ncbi:MAG: glycosyltransferase [Aestuariivirga sp.]
MPESETDGCKAIPRTQVQADAVEAVRKLPSVFGVTDAKSPRIAIFLFSLAGGGAERIMLQLASALARRGLVVDLLLVRKEGPYLDQVPPGIRIIDLAAGRTLTSFGPLYRYIRQARPVALLSALTAVNLVAIITAKLVFGNTRVIVSEHSQVNAELEHTSRLMARLAFRLMPLVYPFAHGIVAVSRGVAKVVAHYARVSPERVTVIYNGVVSPNLHTLADKSVDHPWLATDQPPVILSAGRMVPQKDFTTLIKAFALLRKSRRAYLIILGEGNDRPALERLAEDLGVRREVDFPGFVANPYAMMARAKVFVLSSAWEGLPTVLIEAMACGTPVVATDCPSGPAEILEDGRFGPLVPVGDAPALAAAVIETMDQPLDPELLRARANDFSVERAVETYLSILLSNP